MNYHKPVLLKECIEGLKINSDGIYVDVTYGGGGHSNEILKILDNGKLFAFDRDRDVLQHLPNNKNFKLIQANYKNIKSKMKEDLKSHQNLSKNNLKKSSTLYEWDRPLTH